MSTVVRATCLRQLVSPTGARWVRGLCFKQQFGAFAVNNTNTSGSFRSISYFNGKHGEVGSTPVVDPKIRGNSPPRSESRRHMTRAKLTINMNNPSIHLKKKNSTGISNNGPEKTSDNSEQLVSSAAGEQPVLAPCEVAPLVNGESSKVC